MKKWLMFIVLLMCIFTVACTTKLTSIEFKQTSEFKTLSKVNYPSQEVEYESVESNYTKNLLKFTNTTTKEIFKENTNNELYSPLSFYIALSMVMEGTEGQTQSEILNLLGIDNNETSKAQMAKIMRNNYYSNDKGMMRLANSIWINNLYTPLASYVETLQNDYYCDSYSTNFDKDAQKNICDWINHYTNDLLDLTPEKYNLDTNELIILLLNTVYFDNKWKNEYKKSDTYTDDFYGKVKSTCDYMKHTFTSFCFEGKDYIYVYDYFENNNKIKYILPNEGTSVYDLLKNDVLLLDNSEKEVYVELTLSTPKVKYNCEYDLKDPLTNLNTGSMFTNSSDFKMLDGNEAITVSFVKQNTAIEFNEEGVKAAAVTSFGMAKSAAPGDPFTVKLDRPFIYIIYDKYNVPLFVGIVNKA